MRKLSLLEKLFLYLALPFSILKVALQLFTSAGDKSIINNEKPLTGVKRAKVSKDLSMIRIKEKSKELNVTINDILMTITSISIKQYLKQKGDTLTKTVKLSMPFSLREPPESAADFEYRNNFAILFVDIELVDDFNKGIEIIKKKMQKLKNSLDPFGMYYFT